ncbi:hypothetical protein PENSTE_c012G10387 [Penicillium steckii]|uniref:Uncharacterized protein n=1 Tax=Penicillium steckii TaxID=303698 RepID=A0A1V6T4G5_9EURO|nr:hypothetical protein PENSTE_c012G10387 [Penicillium steckii]
MDRDFIASYEDWSRVITKSPTEINLRPLLEALEDTSAENETCIARYRSRLSEDVDRLPDPLPPTIDINDHESWRNRGQLDWIKSVCGNLFVSTRPRLFLRTRKEIRDPQSINSLWAGRANA